VTVEKRGYVADAARSIVVEPASTTTEPMISTGSGRVVQNSDGWTLRTRDGSLSAHHEHTLVITRGAPVVLTGTAA